jgi:hypothetical protein
MVVCTGMKIGGEISEALGLKHARVIDIHLDYQDVAMITVNYLPDEEDLEKIVPILKKYKLIEGGKCVFIDKCGSQPACCPQCRHNPENEKLFPFLTYYRDLEKI